MKGRSEGLKEQAEQVGVSKRVIERGLNGGFEENVDANLMEYN